MKPQTNYTFKNKQNLTNNVLKGVRNALLASKEAAKKLEVHQEENLIYQKDKGYFTANFPKLYLNELGEKSCLNSTSGNATSPLFFLDLQNLLLYSLLGDRAPFKPSWCNLLRRAKVQSIVLVIVEGIGISDLREVSERKIIFEPQDWLKQSLPHSSHCFHLHLEMFSPSQYSMEVVQEILMMPFSNMIISRLKQKYGSMGKAFHKGKIIEKKDEEKGSIPPSKDEEKGSIHPSKDEEKGSIHPSNTDAFDRLQLLLNTQQMLDRKYPMKIQGAVGFSNPEFNESLWSYKPVTSSSPMFGVDCEMCKTTKDFSALTSVSIVNEKLEVVYTTLVKPKYPIIDYLTRFSGITPAMMKGVTKTLSEVQEDIANVLPEDAILVGHSLNSDLIAMKIFHPYVIDSALIYNLSGRSQIIPGLKLLMKIIMDRDIQTRGSEGHDASEDAAASLELTMFKLSKGLTFGDVRLDPEPDFDMDKVSRVQREISALKKAMNSPNWARKHNNGVKRIDWRKRQYNHGVKQNNWNEKKHNNRVRRIDWRKRRYNHGVQKNNWNEKKHDNGVRRNDWKYDDGVKQNNWNEKKHDNVEKQNWNEKKHDNIEKQNWKEKKPDNGVKENNCKKGKYDDGVQKNDCKEKKHNDRVKKDLEDKSRFFGCSLKFISETCKVDLFTSPLLFEKNSHLYDIPTLNIEKSEETESILDSVVKSGFQTQFQVVHVKVQDSDEKSIELDKIDRGLKNIHENLPDKSLFVTLFTGSNPSSRGGKDTPSGCSLITLKGQDKFYRLKK